MSEIADRYRRLAAAFSRAVEAVPADRWTAPSPCPDWTAIDVVQHVVDVQGMFLGFVDRKPAKTPVAADGAVAAWQAASAPVQTDLDDAERAAATFTGFFGESTFEGAVDRFINFDLVVHRWDLARATGGDEHIDDADAQRVIAAVAEFGESLRSPGACGPVLDVADDADAQTRMLALVGRRA